MLSKAYDGARMDLTWSEVERKKGVYNFSRYDDLADSMDASGLKLKYWILDYSNPIYCPGNEAPQTPEERAAFAAFAVAAAKRFAPSGVVLELWNGEILQAFGIGWRNNALASALAVYL